MTRVTLIVARARNGVIGRGGAIPWYLPEDMAHFKATTTGHSVVMGRRTFESIGKPLPGRRTIVVTLDKDWSHEGCERAGSLEEAASLAALPGPRGWLPSGETFVIGGARLYAEARKVVDRVIVSEIDLEPDGDAFFTWEPSSQWTLRSRTSHRSYLDIDYRIDEWERAR